MADTLAMIACRGATLPGGGQSWASRIVRETLARADEDWRRWATLAPLLPLVAEAAPEQFLDAVERGLRGEDSILARLFRDHDSSMFARTPHVELLWGLERLAWSADHLPRAALALARLDRVDPGGQMLNRPLKSLVDIFLPHRPQTSAPATTRRQVLETLLRREPEVGWMLLLQLIPRGGSINLDAASRPEWRGWAPDDDEPRTWREIFNDMDAIVDLLLQHAPAVPVRWAAVATILDRLPGHTLDQATDALDSLKPNELPDGARGALRDELRSLIARHQRAPMAKWVMPDEFLDRLRTIYDRLEPEDMIECHRWLFSENPALVDVGGQGWQARRDALRERRLEAARLVHQERGLEGLLELALAGNRPVDLGTTIGSEEILSENELYELMSRGFGSGDQLAELATGFARETAGRSGPEWIREVLESERTQDWVDLQKAEFLLSPLYAREVWELVAEIGGQVQQTYWGRTQLHGLREWESAEQAANNLLEHRRPYSALTSRCGCRSTEGLRRWRWPSDTRPRPRRSLHDTLEPLPYSARLRERTATWPGGRTPPPNSERTWSGKFTTRSAGTHRALCGHSSST